MKVHPSLRRSTISVDELVPALRNPRRGNVERIRESLRELGQFRPIVVNRGTQPDTTPGEILAGNHTYFAAVAENAAKIAVSWVDVDRDTADRIILADNRTSDFASYDDPILAEMLLELAASERRLAGTGYDDLDLDELLKADDEPAPPSSFGVDLPTSDDFKHACPRCGYQFG